MSVALPFVRSENALSSDARLAGLGLAAIAIFLFALSAFSPKVLGDGDTWSHLATGEWIIAHGGVPRADPFSHSMPGAPWSGVVLLTGAAAASAVLIVGLSAARDLRGGPLVVMVGLGLGLATVSLLARPHMLALPIAAAWCAGLLAARDSGRAPPLALALLMTAWSNMHGGFVFGLALIGPFALEALAAAPRQARPATAGAWGLFGLAALLAALLNPYGVEALVFPFRLMSVENLSRISEWRAQDFSHVGPMEIALLSLIGFALTRPLAATLIACLAVGAVRLAAPIERVDGTAAPISALKAVPPELRAKPVMNGYAFGGYLIWSRVRPFIDGRADMYGDAMLGLYGKLEAGDPATVERTLKRYDIAWTIFAPDAEIVAMLDREPGWRRLYADAYAVVHVRDNAPPDAADLWGD
jgi:hypothetical protein